MMNLKSKITEILEQVGIYVDDDSQALEFDSLQYITVIVDIEENFDIVIDDTYLYQDEKVSLNSWADMVKHHLDNCMN